MVLKIQVSQKLEKKFREKAMTKYGYHKGSITNAAEEALSLWVREIEIPDKTARKSKTYTTAKLEGLMKNIDIDSVKLQHEAKNIWTEKVLKHVSDRH